MQKDLIKSKPRKPKKNLIDKTGVPILQMPLSILCIKAGSMPAISILPPKAYSVLVLKQISPLKNAATGNRQNHAADLKGHQKPTKKLNLANVALSPVWMAPRDVAWVPSALNLPTSHRLPACSAKPVRQPLLWKEWHPHPQPQT